MVDAQVAGHWPSCRPRDTDELGWEVGSLVGELADVKLINGTARTVREMFTGRKYGLDFYQREYTWTETNVAELLDDLATSFLTDYQPGDEQEKVASYRPYFLGPVVTSHVGGVRYLVDGQQRLTTLTLLLMHLDHLAQGQPGAESLCPLVYSVKFGKPTFNIDVADRTEVMDAVLHESDFDASAADESPRTMWNRYQDIVTLFPSDLAGGPLLHFIDWLLERVVLVEIGTTDQDMALEIFESMNDRGLQLSNTDMLKSFLIARITDEQQITAANALWRARIGELGDLERHADAEFIKAWLRGKYADTIRERKKDALPGDFDVIGTAFHKWARDQKDRLGLHKAGDFAHFVNHDFARLSRRYVRLLEACASYSETLGAVFYNAHNGLTLQLLPIMAAVTPSDTDEIFEHKANLIASYLDLMIARRMVNYRNFGYSTIVYTIFNLAKELRDKDLEAIQVLLADRVAGLEESFDAVTALKLTQRNGPHVAYLLARMTAWLEQGHGPGFAEYASRTRKNRFEIEHIWANHYERHTDQFDDPYTFTDTRSSFGALLLLPKDFNASYGDMTYVQKLPHYATQNLLAKSLHPIAYQHNPTFTTLIHSTGLPFTAYPDDFTATSIEAREDLYRRICEVVWDPERLGLGGGSAPKQSRDFYVCFGHDEHRDWNDARRYGFISAGGGRWYTQSLSALKLGDRVFAYIPERGYVGMGTVTESVRPAHELIVERDGESNLLRNLPVAAVAMWDNADKEEHAEHAVRVTWTVTRELDNAVWEKGMFANQNSACRLSDAFTRDRLLAIFVPEE
jgi:hypothetical protein